VENWGNIEVSKPKPPLKFPTAKQKVAAGEKLRLRVGQQSEPLPIGAQVEQYAFVLKDGNQGELEFEFEAAKVRGNVVLFEIGVERKEGSAKHIRTDPDMQKSRHIRINPDMQKPSDAVLCEALVAGMRALGHPVSPNFARTVLEKMNWPAPEFVLAKAKDSIERCRVKREPFRIAWLKSSICQDVLEAWPQVQAEYSKWNGHQPFHCIHCGAPPDARSKFHENKCKACNQPFAPAEELVS
jgi:hypothetical protein